ncbi:MAG: sporulation protein [Oscillospiraceae bacterium]|jgi:sporulation integral membrane protein YlbJ|nr:sporulation protein [Oscillospiraceae bacterium]
MKFRTGTLLLAALSAACAMLIFPAQAAQGAKNGIGYCLEVLIPSLYPFMVLSVFVVKSGLAHKIGGWMERLTQTLFRLPGSTAPTIFMSVIGGYPAGARSIASLYEEGEIDQKQAERMLGFCVNAGPSFVITAVGAGFLKDPHAGVILFAAQIVVFLLLGIGCGLTAKHEPHIHKKQRSDDPGIAQALILSAADAARAMINMCCFVILFAALMNLLRMVCTDPTHRAGLSALLEVTGGCSDLARLGVPPWAFSAAIGWGGICVHFQVLSSLTELKFSRVRFVMFRLLQAVLSAAVSWGLMLLFPETKETFCSFAGPVSGALSATPPASVALLVLCSALLLCAPCKKLEILQQQ